MARNVIQFQKGLSLPDFQRLYGTEEQCEAALEKARWPGGFRCPRCNGHEHGLVYGRRLKCPPTMKLAGRRQARWPVG
ncbi:transposase [Synechococcus sp. CBW1108]|nr:transposase [Synechococcus sp. CBW1108]